MGMWQKLFSESVFQHKGIHKWKKKETWILSKILRFSLQQQIQSKTFSNTKQKKDKTKCGVNFHCWDRNLPLRILRRYSPTKKANSTLLNRCLICKKSNKTIHKEPWVYYEQQWIGKELKLHPVLEFYNSRRTQDKRRYWGQFEDIFSYFSMKTYDVTPHQNRLDETVLKMGHKICFYGEIWLIIPKLSLLSLLIWSTESPLLIRRPHSIKATNAIYIIQRYDINDMEKLSRNCSV